MKKYLLALLFVIPFSSGAKCWVVSNLEGYSSFKSDGYKYIKNGMAKSVFHVDITNDSADLKMTDNNLGGGGLIYIPVSQASMVGMFKNDVMSTIETWAITSENKVLYTKVVNGHKMVTGTTSLVGDVIGSCD